MISNVTETQSTTQIPPNTHPMESKGAVFEVVVRSRPATGKQHGGSGYTQPAPNTVKSQTGIHSESEQMRAVTQAGDATIPAVSFRFDEYMIGRTEDTPKDGIRAMELKSDNDPNESLITGYQRQKLKPASKANYILLGNRNDPEYVKACRTRVKTAEEERERRRSKLASRLRMIKRDIESLGLKPSDFEEFGLEMPDFGLEKLEELNEQLMKDVPRVVFTHSGEIYKERKRSASEISGNGKRVRLS
ncbi:hypothetical protein BJ508DRAFT_330396 [Ascobolus immersus RN42]|uniref:Uncharacterized protein n=1 Tax=Ascobolus immersus RN42 TaxID=1160509 RepID=A0A3N4HXG5_ASCIM|nr:hypothetical protein BJ508DRAFT_330396 [Ascobolus immersus RN42]